MALNLVTLAEIKSEIGQTSSDLDARATYFGEWAEGWCERYLSARFKAESRAEYYSGNQPFIQPRILPIASITSIVDTFDDASAFTLDTDFTLRDDLIYFGASGERPFIWPQGHHRYLVTYVAGYLGTSQTPTPMGAVSPPAGIKAAVLVLCRRIWKTRGGIKAESKDKTNVTWDEIAMGEIATMLDPYRLRTEV